MTYPKPLTISRHTLKAVKRPLLTRRERAGLLVQSRLHSRSGRRFALVLARTHLPAATINALVQLLVPPPKYHVERLVPGVEVAPEAHLTGMVVIQRGGLGGLALDEHEALETLMSNCEDAYGFPPYSAIEGSLRRRNGSDLKDVERAHRRQRAQRRPGGRAAQRVDGLVASAAGSRPRLDGAGCDQWGARLPHLARQGRPSFVGHVARLAFRRRRCWRVILALAAALRVWRLNDVGFNSDEAVYAGQAAAIATDPELDEFFPVFRAHPLLFQTVLSLGFRLHLAEGFERFAAAAARRRDRLPGLRAGPAPLRAARRAAGGPADGADALPRRGHAPGAARRADDVLRDAHAAPVRPLPDRPAASGGCTPPAPAMGLTVLSKETSIVLLGGLYAFLALTPELRVRLRDLAVALGLMALVVAPFPLSLMLAGRTGTGESYLTWQLFRRPNHDWLFYLQTVPEAIGPLVLLAAVMGLWLLRREASWRERLLLCWIAVPVVFFQLWPVKGFQYLLPIAPAIAVLAGRALSASLGLAARCSACSPPPPWPSAC